MQDENLIVPPMSNSGTGGHIDVRALQKPFKDRYRKTLTKPPKLETEWSE